MFNNILNNIIYLIYYYIYIKILKISVTYSNNIALNKIEPQKTVTDSKKLSVTYV